MQRAWSVRNAAIVGVVFGGLSVAAKAMSGAPIDAISMTIAVAFCALIFAGVATMRNHMIGA